MKKIAFGFLTLMMLFGGVFLSACGERNISISVSSNEVEVYTNNLQEDEFENITVTLNDSDDGIGVQVESQNDVVSVTTPERDRNGNYNFTINALRSGSALIRVYSIEKPSVYEYINVNSYTYLEELSSLDLSDENGRSGLYIIEGGQGVDLSPENYFNLYPLDANVRDISWTFSEGGTSLSQSGQVIAEIVNNQTLYVYEGYIPQEINLVASFVQMPSVHETLTLAVIDDSNITSFNIGQSDEDRTLIRNDANESTVNGSIVVDTFDDKMTANLVAYLRNGENITQIENYQDYFTVSEMTYTYDNGQMVINFTIDAQVDPERRKLSGDVYVAFELQYSEYTYQISTISSYDLVCISTYFIPETLLVRDETSSSISGQTIELYSNYFSGHGYGAYVNVYPDDVVLNNSNYQITINDVGGQMTVNPNYYLKVYRENDTINPISFERLNANSSTWISEEITNGTKVYLQAGDGNFGTIANYQINFVASGNGTATESIYANLYSVTDNPNLNLFEYTIDEETGQKVEVGEFNFDQVYYISSSENSMQKEFYIRLKGYSTSTGLELVYNQNNNFSINYVENGGLQDVNNPQNSYVDLIVTVNVRHEGYEGAFNFSFTHRTGASSEAISTYAFAPIENVSIINNDKGATNIYYEDSNSQDFVMTEEDGVTANHPEYMTNNTLSSLLISAGSNVNLELNYGNATLNATENTLGYYFAYLDFNTFATSNADNFNGQSEAEIRAIFNNLTPFLDDSYVYNFTTENNNYFTYTNGYLRVASEQGEFVVYVAVVFNGYDENHEELNIVRIFKLESFYPVNSLRSSVTDTSLYARESLSSTDEDLSYVDVYVNLRLDKNEPTYKDLSNFSISLRNGITNVVANEEEGQTYEVDGNGEITRAFLNSSTIENEYVILSGFEIRQADQTSLGPNALMFRITAKSTQFNSNWSEIVNLVYELSYEGQIISTLGTNINVEIIQADRIEKVTWINKTENGEIYLNLATNNPSEQTFTISTSVYPENADNRNLTYYYRAYDSNDSVLEIDTVAVSQSFNLTIGNTSRGGYGYLYILPEDMVKTVAGISQIIYYGLDESGEIAKEAQYLPLSQIDVYYENLVNGTTDGSMSNYFLNNYGEKVYYRDIILKIRVTVADGLSEETAIRVYSQEDLENVQSGLYYRVMNDIELNNWSSLNTLSGMIFGDNDDITLTFTGNSSALVDTLSGTIKNLTMAGNVVGGGFVANHIAYGGLVDNVTVDVNYLNNNYCPSTITGGVSINNANYIGGIAGENLGTISNSYVFGLNIILSQNLGNIAGGIVGLNYGTIRNSGVEFYKFVETEVQDEIVEEITYNNSFTANIVGGLVGRGEFRNQSGTTIYSEIYNSYVYAFNLVFDDGTQIEDSSLCDYKKVLNGQDGYVGAFVGYLNANNTNVFRLENSFAFLGDYKDSDYFGIGHIDGAGNKIYRNSYITYIVSNEETINGELKNVYRLQMDYILSAQTSGALTNVQTLSYSNIESIDYQNLGFNSSIWQIEDIDSAYNFGFAYLKGVNQNIAVSVDQTVQNVDGKTVNADYLSGGQTVKAGILFLYRTQENVVNDAALSELNRLNTISIIDLFGVTESEAQSLLVSVDRADYINFTTNSLTAKRTNINLGQTIKLTLYSRVDFSESQTFEFMVLDYIPNLTLTVGDNTLGEGQILNIQTGNTNSRQVQIVLDYSIYLNGEEYTLVNNESFGYSVNFDENNSYISEGETKNYISRYISGNNITFTASAETINTYVGTTVDLGLTKLENNFNDFNTALKSYRQTNFYISSYLGANSVIVDTKTLNITPQESVDFNVVINSDRPDENLALTFTYNNIDYTVNSDNQVVVNDNLVLDVSVTPKSTDGTTKEYNVIINVNKNFRHKVDRTYNFVISVNALSQVNNNNYVKTIDFVVQKQNINVVNVTAYNIDRRVINNSRWYYTPSTTISSTLVPGSDSILTMEVSPNFAHFSRVDVTYVASSTGSVGTVGISRLALNPTYGYYIDSSTTDNINSGIRVTPTDSDLQNGVYYFRIYISSSFTSNSNVTLTFTFYDGNEIIGSPYTYNYVIDYVASAEVLVDGAHSVMLAKGDSAQVSITLELDQTLTNNSIRLENNGASITLSSLNEETTNSYRLYTATINTSVLSTLADGNPTGAFYVYASVSRYVNGILDYVESYATVYLVDFTINAEETKVVGSSQQATYNGNTYDAFNSYINAEQVLAFDYVIEPESYNFNAENTDEYNAVYGPNGLMAKRTEFVRNGSYRDDVSGYYINYVYNSNTGTYERLSIEDRLYYVNNDGSATSIYNSQTGTFLENSIIEFSMGSYDTLRIKGLRIGSVLLRLTTTVIIGNTTFSYDYDFVVQISIWTDEEVPMPIYTAEEFLTYAQGNPDDQGNTVVADYILMNDIVLENYTPVDTTYFRSLDGNGYQIYINNFNMTSDSTANTLNLALFNEVSANSTIKNVRVNLYNAGQITVNINQYRNINIAGFALTNNGIIYNCEVVAYYDTNHSTSRISGSTGLVVSFSRGSGMDNVILTSQDIQASNINISGFVGTNNNIITNSRVGGESVGTIIETENVNYYSEVSLPTFTIQGQGTVTGFVNYNFGTISASFANSVQIYNLMNSTTSITAGFVISNSGEIHTSYVQGTTSGNTEEYYYDGSTINSTGRVSGFVYSNYGLVKNSYVNIAFEVDISKSYLSAGFVYENDVEGEITLCYAAAKMANTDINEMSFSGVSDRGEDLNHNPNGITYSYYYAERNDTSPQGSYEVGAYAVTDVSEEATFYRFSFSSVENALDGIWTINDGFLTLTSANHIAYSNRDIVYNSNDEDDYYYLYSTLTDINNFRQIDLSYGSLNNPIIIRSAADFAKATGKAQDVEISSYKQYYNDYEVFGNYRLVNNLDFSEIDQNLTGENNIRLTTTSKTFSGILDGNSFTISNISLGSSQSLENYGLFAELDGAVVMNLGLQVVSVHDRNAQIVGTLAGTAIDSRLIAINLSPNERRDEEEIIQAVSIAGYNIVGGLVGVVMGESALNDITVTDIDVHSAYYYGEGKPITRNNTYTGDNLRQLVNVGASLDRMVRELSYAGGVAGYVDIYTNLGDGYIQYSTQASITDYEITSIKVLESVDIYGEVSGGLFGYLGKSTRAYDLGLEVNADMALNNPSYITSKNLYAGGIVGESYAGLYAVYAKYSESLQDIIDLNMLNSNPTERGQLSIFSYSSNDTLHNDRYNNPYYFGGIVGYAGAGYIAIAYNRLNVTSNTDSNNSTQAVGGVVGYIDSNYNYNSDFIDRNVNISYYLNEVYFSGVIYSQTNANAGGIIGELSVDNDIALDKVNSIPYYDSSISVNNVYSLIAGFAGEDGKTPDNLYMIDERGSYHNIFGESATDGTARMSVAVANQYLVDMEKTSTYINGLTTEEVLQTVNNSYRPILEIEQPSAFGTMDRAHSAMASYFLQNNWDSTRWEHAADNLFPDIVLYPRSEVIFLDADPNEIANDIAAIKANLNGTIVVRGRVNKDIAGTYGDVDLRGLFDSNNGGSINGFSGTIISYENYMRSQDEGIISAGQEVTQNLGVGTDNYYIGGKEGDNVGIILDSPMFTNPGQGFTMDGINIYLANADGSREGTSSTNSYDMTFTNSVIVDGNLEDATLVDLNIYINGNLTFDTNQTNIGLIANSALSTNFQSINFIFRYSVGTQDGEISPNNPVINLNVEAASGDASGIRKFGLIAGTLTQRSVYNSSSISNVVLMSERKTVDGSYNRDENVKLEVNIVNNNTVDSTTGTNIANNSLYFGFLIGEALVDSTQGVLPLNFGINNLINDTFQGINLTIKENDETKDDSLNNLYFGGYFGRANLTAINVIGGAAPTSLIKNFIVHQKISVTGNMSLGLGFGELEGAGTFAMNIESSGQESSGVDISGGLYQFAGFTTGETKTNSNDTNSVNIGGFVGSSNYNFILSSGLNVNFDVKGNQPLKTGTGNNEQDTGFENYDKLADSQEVNPIYSASDFTFDKVNGVWQANNEEKDIVEAYVALGELNIGSFIGLSEGGAINFSEIYISPYCDIQISNKSEDYEDLNQTNLGTIGYVSAGSINLGGNNKYSVVNYFVETNGTANVGGLAGKVTATNFEAESYMYNGTVINFANTICFGGLVGNVTVSGTGRVTNAVYGGILKNFVKDPSSSTTSSTTSDTTSTNTFPQINGITVGGVFGNLSATGSSSFRLDGIYTYGNVFVNYESNSQVLDLSTFFFGGIIGNISSGSAQILNAYSLMTPFNDRLVEEGLTANYGVNAFVGGNAELASFSGGMSYYSSGVTMSYQYAENAIDVSYGFNDENYYGYSSKEIDGSNSNSSNDNTATTNSDLSGQIPQNQANSERGIIDIIYSKTSEFTTFPRNEYGLKLNPILVTNEGASDGSKVTFSGISSNDGGIDSMDIKWYYFEEDLTVEQGNNTNNGSLNNVVIVGNGKTINFETTDGQLTVNSKVAPFKALGTKNNSYSAISGLLVEVDFSYELSKSSSTTDQIQQVAGLITDLGAEDNSGSVTHPDNPSIMIYAVGVVGSAEFGSTGSVKFGGIVTNMYKGMLSNSYVDLDIFYHAGVDDSTIQGAYLPSSTISAITNVDGLVEIYNTFANGQVKSYVPANIYTFNSLSTETDTSSTLRTRIYDSYTVMQVEVEDYGFGNAYNITNFQGLGERVFFSDYSGLIGTTTVNNNGTLITSVLTRNINAQRGIVNNMSVGYNSGNAVRYAISGEFSSEEDSSTEIAFSPWFFSPYRNYGYGTTGFVYLRNTTTYYRTQTNNEDTVNVETESGIEQKNYAYNTYEYTKLSEKELSSLSLETKTVKVTIDGTETQKDYFLAISNVGKFRQIENLNGANSRFFLKYDLDLDDLYNNENGSNEGWNYNGDNNLGSSENVVVIDGQNHLLEFGGSQDVTRGLFGIVYANIENIRIIAHDNITTENTNTPFSSESESESETSTTGLNYGILAGSYTGRLINATIQGSINLTSSTNTRYIGGIAGQFTGTIATVENLVDIQVNGGANYIGGLVGKFTGEENNNYGLTEQSSQEENRVSIVDGGISYSSNNGSIVADSSTSQGTVIWSNDTDVNGDNQNDNALNYSKNDSGLDLTITTEHNANSGGVNDDSNGQNRANDNKTSTETKLVTTIGGIAGYLDSGSITYSYNNATIMNNYQSSYTGTRQIRNLASGGIAGYSNGQIDNTINTGYIVSGNNQNEGVALAGGIVGYTKGKVSNSINDAKVQSLSYINNEYYNMSLDQSGIENTSNEVKLIFTLEYNLPNVFVVINGVLYDNGNIGTYKMPRLVHAYGIGYFGSTDTSQDSNNINLDSNEIVNDGNIGYTVRTVEKTFTAQRYADGDDEIINGKDKIGDRFNYFLNDDGTPDIKVSAYDSYGFPSRLNYYYEYSFDIEGFKHGYSDFVKSNTTGVTEFLSFLITDDTPKDTTGDSKADTNSESVDPENLYPGGTSQYYFSIPFYSTEEGVDNGNSYQELVEDINYKNSNLNNTSSGSQDDLNALYDKINVVREGHDEDTNNFDTIDINGTTYNLVKTGEEYTAFTGGVGISGSIPIDIPTISGAYNNGTSIEDEITVTPVNIASINFTIVDEKGEEIDVSSIGSNAEIRQVGNNYTLHYTAYYNKNDLVAKIGSDQDKIEKLKLNVDYRIIYEYSTQISLTKGNMKIYDQGTSYRGVQVDFIGSGGTTSQTLGEFLNEAFSKYYNSNKASLQVYFINPSNGLSYYYDLGTNNFIQGTGENVKNALKLNLVGSGDLSSYIGVLNFYENNASTNHGGTKRDEFINYVSTNNYIMTLVYYVQGTGSFDHTVGGAQSFEQYTSREIEFGSSGEFTDEQIEDIFGETTSGNTITYSVDMGQFRTAIMGSTTADITINISSQGGTGGATLIVNYLEISASNYTFSVGGSQNGTIAETGIGYTISGSTITISNVTDPGNNVSISLVVYYPNAVNVPATVTEGISVQINGQTYEIQGEYEIVVGASGEIYDQNGNVIDGFLYDSAAGQIKRNGGSSNQLNVRYEFSKMSNSEGGNIQIAQGGDNQLVFIVNDGFYYTLNSDGSLATLEGMGVAFANINYIEMKDFYIGGNISSIGNTYRFYKLNNIPTYHGILLSGYGYNYVCTETTYNNGIMTYTLTREGEQNPLLIIYRLSYPTSNNDDDIPGYEFAINYLDTNEIKYQIIEYNTNNSYNVVQENGSWANDIEKYLLNYDLSSLAFNYNSNRQYFNLYYDKLINNLQSLASTYTLIPEGQDSGETYNNDLELTANQIKVGGVWYNLHSEPELEVTLMQGNGGTTIVETYTTEIGDDGNIYFLGTNNERIAMLEENNQVVLVSDGTTVIATVDENFDLSFVDESYQNILAKTTETISNESSYIYKIVYETGEYYEGTTIAKIATIQIEITNTSILSSLFNNYCSSALIANNITNNTSNTPIVNFTEASLSSYAGQNVEFNAANYGPTAIETDTELYYGPSEINFTVDISNVSNINALENPELEIITSNTEFKDSGELIKGDKNYSYTISIDEENNTNSFANYDNRGYSFSLNLPFEVADNLSSSSGDNNYINIKDLNFNASGNIIITDNLYVLDMPSTINSMIIQGYDHLITKKLSLGTFDYAVKVGSGGKVYNLNFALVADGETASKSNVSANAFVVTTSEETRVSNVSIYGSVRKINTNQVNYSAVDIEKGVSNILTNLSLIGADGESASSVSGISNSSRDGESVVVTLQANVGSGTIGTNKIILVAGNGGNGSNGVDGKRAASNSNNPVGGDGVNGSNGGTGGSVSGGSINISGADGVAGNGGNGADGLNARKVITSDYSIRNGRVNYSTDSSRGKAGGGGAGGNSGNPGDGEDANSSKTNRIYSLDLPGSGGSGGLGMYYSGVENYDTDYYYKYIGNGYTETGYSTNPQTDTTNVYVSWIKTSGGGGSAGDMLITNGQTSSGGNGLIVVSNTNLLQRGYNQYRGNIPSTSGYYWNYGYGTNGRERLFGNLQMTSTFSYYGTNPSDTGPVCIDWGRYNGNGDIYAIESDLEFYLTNTQVQLLLLGRVNITGIVSLIASAILASEGFTMLSYRNSNMLFIGNDDNYYTIADFRVSSMGMLIAKLIEIVHRWFDQDYAFWGNYEQTFFGIGELYSQDGGINDYWWLNYEDNVGAKTYTNASYLSAFNKYLYGISSNYKKFKGSLIDGGSNVWEDNFYGGLGGGNGSGENGNGGTSFTKEIYGYARADAGKITLIEGMLDGIETARRYRFEDGDDGYKCFFTRNDMVTSAGKYGDAKKNSDPSKTSALTDANITIVTNSSN